VHWSPSHCYSMLITKELNDNFVSYQAISDYKMVPTAQLIDRVRRNESHIASKQSTLGIAKFNILYLQQDRRCRSDL